MAIEIADLLIKNGDFRWQTVKLPEGKRWGLHGQPLVLSWNMAQKNDDFNDLPRKSVILYSYRLKTRTSWL